MSESGTVPLATYKALKLRFLELALEISTTKTPGYFVSPQNRAAAQALREAALYMDFEITRDEDDVVYATDPSTAAKSKGPKRFPKKKKAPMKKPAATHTDKQG